MMRQITFTLNENEVSNLLVYLDRLLSDVHPIEVTIIRDDVNKLITKISDQSNIHIGVQEGAQSPPDCKHTIISVRGICQDCGFATRSTV